MGPMYTTTTKREIITTDKVPLIHQFRHRWSIPDNKLWGWVACIVRIDVKFTLVVVLSMYTRASVSLSLLLLSSLIFTRLTASVSEELEDIFTGTTQSPPKIINCVTVPFMIVQDPHTYKHTYIQTQSLLGSAELVN